MKKAFLILFFFLGLIPAIYCQKVDSIKTEQTGDVIKIHYKILNSDPTQVFKVTILCSINGGLESVLKSLSGDYGDNVVGGRTDYMVLWDVLKDVDEIRTVNFSIKAELVKGEPQSIKSPKKGPPRKIHVMAVINTKASQGGLRLGYMGNWGVAVGFVSGDIPLKNFFPTNPTITDESVPYNVFTLDLTKSIIKKNKFQLHAIAGVATAKRAGDKYVSYFQNYSGRYTGFNGGLVMDYGMLAISVEMTSLPKFMGTSSLNSIFFGLGMRF